MKCIFLGCVTFLFASIALAEPEQKDVDQLLKRVRVEYVGSALAQPKLARELKLSKEQLRSIDTIISDAAMNLSKAIEPEKGKRKRTGYEEEVDALAAMENFSRESDQEILKILNADQLRRLKQIQLQKEGPSAILGRIAIRELEITADQEEVLATELAKWCRSPISDELIAMQVSGRFELIGDKEQKEFNRVLNKAAREMDRICAAMLKHLSAEQYTKWQKLCGEKIERGDLILSGSAFGNPVLVKALYEAGSNRGLPDSEEQEEVPLPKSILNIRAVPNSPPVLPSNLPLPVIPSLPKSEPSKR